MLGALAASSYSSKKEASLVVLSALGGRVGGLKFGSSGLGEGGGRGGSMSVALAIAAKHTIRVIWEDQDLGFGLLWLGLGVEC